jgi:hypothetical protein
VHHIYAGHGRQPACTPSGEPAGSFSNVKSYLSTKQLCTDKKDSCRLQ